MNKYRKKPVVIEAEQYIATNDRLPFCESGDPVEYDEDEHRPYVNSLEGKHWVSDGDWIIRGVKGEFYACKPDIFALTYEPESARPEAAFDMMAELKKKLPQGAPVAWRWRHGTLGPWAYDEMPPRGIGVGECTIEPLYASLPQNNERRP